MSPIRWICSLFLVTILFSISGCKKIDDPPEIAFTTIVKSNYVEMNNGRFVINSASDWHESIQGHDLPSIDFAKEMIIAICIGTKPSSGYGVQVRRIIAKKNQLEVEVDEWSPAPGEIVFFILTKPCHIIRLQRIDKSVEFITSKD